MSQSPTDERHGKNDEANNPSLDLEHDAQQGVVLTTSGTGSVPSDDVSVL